MSSLFPSKINKLLQKMPKGVVATSSWLSKLGYSSDLVRSYRKSKWLESVGHGAVKRYNEKVDYLGAIYALQKQLKLSIHPAARTALHLQGRSHYLELDQQEVYLFGTEKESLPSWFVNYDWGVTVHYTSSSFLPAGLGMIQQDLNSFSILISGAPRALMESLYLAVNEHDFIASYELIEGMNNLRPNIAQQLLEQCTSVKVKRLFLYMAEKAQHPWLEYIDLKKIDLGKGNRSLVQNGRYVSKYKITVPKELAEYGEL